MSSVQVPSLAAFLALAARVESLELRLASGQPSAASGAPAQQPAQPPRSPGGPSAEGGGGVPSPEGGGGVPSPEGGGGGDTFLLYVKTAGEKLVIVMESSADTICAVRAKIQDKQHEMLKRVHGPEVDRPVPRKLMYAGKQLECGRTLSDYNVQKGDTIQVSFSSGVHGTPYPYTTCQDCKACCEWLCTCAK
jgi:large subunit ribosomal protein L40e